MTKRAFTLYWSNLALYENCPRQFLWKNGWGDIDLGAGPGRRKVIPKEHVKSAHHAFMGVVIQAVIERMYQDELWRDKSLLERLEVLYNEKFQYYLPRFEIDWQQTTLTELQDTVHEGIFNFLRTFKHNKLIGPYAKCEADYVAYINKYNPIGGRFDFLIRRDDVGTMILDGKNGKRYRDKKTGVMTMHIDPDQLRFYALAFWLSHKVMPDKLGFVLYRYPWGYVPPEDEWAIDSLGLPVKPEPDTGVTWVDFSMDMLKALAHRAVDARQGMEKGKFDPVPEPSKCKFCDFQELCPERQAQRVENASRRGGGGAKQGLVPEGTTGLVSFGFGKPATPTGVQQLGFPPKG